VARLAAFTYVAITLLVSSASAQNQSPASDPQAVAYAAKSIAALTGGSLIRDIRMTAQAAHIAGADYDNGAATLEARGTRQSRIDLEFGDKQRTEVRRDKADSPVGSWSDGKTTHRMARHNCWTGAAWFYPAFILAETRRPDVVLSYLGLEQRDGLSVYHLRSYRVTKAQPVVVANLVKRLSTTDIYLDSTSLLPLILTFNVHPDNDSGTDIRTETRFVDYRIVDGVRVPFHIQQLINDGLVLDLNVTSATINSGLSESDFSVQ
jgi:hypothetical protein